MLIGIGIHGWTHMPVQVYYNHLAAGMSWMKWGLAEGHQFAISTVGHSVVAKARERIVDDLIKLGCDLWLSLDTDHLIPMDLLQRLLELFPGPAMASALITKRLFPYDTVAFKYALTEPKKLVGVYVPRQSGVHEVDGCAMGCTLIDLKKLAALPKPWFQDTELGRSDLNLCAAFRATGERILVHSDVEAAHLGDPLLVTPELAESLRAKAITVSMERSSAC